MRFWRIRGWTVLAALCAAATAACVNPAVSGDSGASARVPITEGTAVTPDGVRLHYRVAGVGGEVVLAPFALYHGSAFDPLARGRRIVTYDPRGRGRSEAVTPDRVSLDLLLTDLDTLRRALGAERVSIIGWSGGGMESFVYALRNPGRVRRLVQLAPVGPRLSPYSDEMVADRRRRTDAAAAAALAARVEAGAFAADPAGHCRAARDVSQPALFADQAKIRLVPNVCIWPNEHPAALNAYFGGLFASILGYDWLSELSSVRIPRLVIHARQDNIPLAGSQEWVRGQPNARLLLIEGAGHFPHYEQPRATLEAIDTFLDGRWPAGARALPAS